MALFAPELSIEKGGLEYPDGGPAGYDRAGHDGYAAGHGVGHRPGRAGCHPQRYLDGHFGDLRECPGHQRAVVFYGHRHGVYLWLRPERGHGFTYHGQPFRYRSFCRAAATSAKTGVAGADAGNTADGYYRPAHTGITAGYPEPGLYPHRLCKGAAGPYGSVEACVAQC